jgi:hypothetical protein
MSRRASCRSTGGAARQRGAILFIGLILLALVTLHALATFATGTAQLRATGNMQARHEARAAAEAAIAAVLSGEAFLDAPSAVSAAPVDVDIDGDGGADYRVRLAASCESARPVPMAALDPASPEDYACATGSSFGPASICADTSWNIRAVAGAAPGAAATGAAVEVNQGIRVRVDAAQARAAC